MKRFRIRYDPYYDDYTYDYMDDYDDYWGLLDDMDKRRREKKKLSIIGIMPTAELTTKLTAVSSVRSMVMPGYWGVERVG